MSDKSHPGDWLWFIFDGRMVAATPDAYAEARRLADDDAPDAWRELRAKGGTFGDLIKLALDALQHGGSVRVELREIVGRDDIRWPVYALAPPEAVAEAQDRQHRQRAKRVRRNRPAPSDAPALVLVEGGASDP